MRVWVAGGQLRILPAIKVVSLSRKRTLNTTLKKKEKKFHKSLFRDELCYLQIRMLKS